MLSIKFLTIAPNVATVVNGAEKTDHEHNSVMRIIKTLQETTLESL